MQGIAIIIILASINAVCLGMHMGMYVHDKDKAHLWCALWALMVIGAFCLTCIL